MNTLADKRIANVLSTLHKKAAIDNEERQHQKTIAAEKGEPFRRGWDTAYMAVTEEEGDFLHFIAKAVKAKKIVEFGCSFGISTIYLAAAAKDNGGKVITTDIEPNKVAGTRKNMEEAGLIEYAEIRLGNALETLADVEAPIDLLFLDGAKELYLPLFDLLQPKLSSGAIVLADNVDKPEAASFLSRLSDSDEITSTILHEGRLLAAVLYGG